MSAAPQATLSCRCGAVTGHVADASPRAVNHALCYCADCQAFAHHLGRADLLDNRGGSDVVQVAPATLRFARGLDRIRGVRLTPKGLFRWYAECCNTPLGNTVGPAIPLVGLVTAVFETGGQTAERLFGKAHGAVNGEHAIGGPPPGSKGIPFRLILPAVFRVARWWLKGKARPNPFFDPASGKPRYPVAVLPRVDRDALRPLCGPHPSRPPA
jgi:hypothetical protein